METNNNNNKRPFEDDDIDNQTNVIKKKKVDINDENNESLNQKIIKLERQNKAMTQKIDVINYKLLDTKNTYIEMKSHLSDFDKSINDILTSIKNGKHIVQVEQPKQPQELLLQEHLQKKKVIDENKKNFDKLLQQNRQESVLQEQYKNNEMNYSEPKTNNQLSNQLVQNVSQEDNQIVKFILIDNIVSVKREVINRIPKTFLAYLINKSQENEFTIKGITFKYFTKILDCYYGIYISDIPVNDKVFMGLFKFYGLMKSIFGSDCIYSIGGQNGEDTIDSIDCYYPKVNIWIKTAKLPQTLRRTGCVIHNDILYVIGGHNGYRQQQNMICYDIKNNKWFNSVSMTSFRTALSVVSAHGLIFAIGGFHEKEPVDIVEVFNINLEKWLTYNHTLNVKRVGHASVYDPVSDKIYVIGGWDSVNDNFDSCEVLDLKHPERGFQMIAKMNTPRGELSAVCVNGKIYAIGGYNGSTFLSTVEVYNPVKNVWTYISPMMFERGWPAASVCDGKIYVSGGRFKPGSMLNTMEVYDPKINKWYICENMIIARDGHQMVSYKY